MLYTDPRGAEECRLLCEALGEEHISALTGTRPHPMYSISKIMWLKNNLPDAFKRAKRILLGEDYIVYLLTGRAQIDYSLAARTGAFDIRNKCWCEEIFKAAGVDISFTNNENRGAARYRAALGLLMGVERTRQMMKIGFIGTGNMGGALASAAARSGEVEVLLANRTKAKAETLAERVGAVVSSNEIIAHEADHIFLGVKPQMIVDVLKGIAPALKERKSAPVLISMVTGPDIARIQELAGGDYPVIRIMPNTPSAVGQGLMLVSANDRCNGGGTGGLQSSDGRIRLAG